MDVVKRVLSFWFDEPELDLAAEGEARMAWFVKDDAFDQAIGDGFGADVVTAARGDLDHLANTGEGALALCILLDQFPRNLFRGSAEAFAHDAKALDIAKGAIEKGFDLDMGVHRRIFFYLPFEHSEDKDMQVRAVELIGAMGNEHYYHYVLEHYYVASRFGRFPGRNEALGRESTPEELTFLKTFSAF